MSPVLSNIYLDRLDRFVEQQLLPEYTRGKRRRRNPAYQNVDHQIDTARRHGLFVPRDVIRQRCANYTRSGQPAQRGALIRDTDHSIVAQYQSGVTRLKPSPREERSTGSLLHRPHPRPRPAPRGGQ